MHCKAKHIPIIVSNYEGEGTSETIEHKKSIVKTKKKIIKDYYTEQEYNRVAFLKVLSLYSLKEHLGLTRFFKKHYEMFASFVSQKRANRYNNGEV